MSLSTLIFVSPHPAGSRGLPNRPACLLSAFIAARAFDEVIVVNRLRPTAFLRHIGRGQPIVRGGLLGTRSLRSDGAVLIEHRWPFGPLERRFLHGLLGASAGQTKGGVIAWVADPKSVTAVVARNDGQVPWRVVVDAYDAWDLSPLVRGDRRLRAVTDGYRTAAAKADLVFANTILMLDRLSDLGARGARHLPNAAPPLDRGPVHAADGAPGLLYVGRIHERFDAALASSLAAAMPATSFTIAGPVERQPAGWSALANHPNVRLLGTVEPEAARDMIKAATALVIPHLVDDYTRSQDAMKAWDAIASGTPIVSTAIPPVVDWPTGLAEVCPDTDSFVAAARRAVAGHLEHGRADRLAFAAENQWSARAAVAIEAMDGLTGIPATALR